MATGKGHLSNVTRSRKRLNCDFGGGEPEHDDKSQSGSLLVLIVADLNNGSQELPAGSRSSDGPSGRKLMETEDQGRRNSSEGPGQLKLGLLGKMLPISEVS